MAEDRNLLLDLARNNGFAARSTSPACRDPAPARALQLRADRGRPARGHAPSRTAALNAAGAPGRKVLADIDTYLVGINHWYAKNRPVGEAVRARRHLRDQRDQGPVPRPGRRRGGRERAVPRRRARPGSARAAAPQVYEDLRQRNDPGDHDHHEPSRAAPDRGLRAPGAKGSCGSSKGSFKSRRDRAAGRGGVGRDRRSSRRRRTSCWSTASRSATGTPIMAGGPQIGYNYPGLTTEIGLYGPTIRARGATAAPFPGYMLIGRGRARPPGRSPRRTPTSSTRTPRGSAAARARATATRASAAGWSG